MTKINDGGPAFPRTGDNKDPYDYSHDGMSLRDYFAGQALAGYMPDFQHHKHSEKHIATSCYIIADAMLKAREAKP